MENTLTSKNIQDIYKLSPMQEGMYYHMLLDRTSSAHFEQISYHFHGSLKSDLAKKSLTELFKRHDILRTVFNHEKGGRPLQVVLRSRDVEYSDEDLRSYSQDDQINIIKKYKYNDVKRSFDLTKDVLMRVAVFQLEENKFEFVWSFHHILMDGWCLGIIASEFFEIYNSLLYERLAQLSPVKRFRTYIDWLEKQDNENAKNYWKKYLEGFDENTGLQPSGIQKVEYKDSRLYFQLDKLTTSKLHQLGRKYETTLNIIIQTLWGILLSKYNNKRDVTFGTIVSGRPSEIEGVETMVGLFINTIPTRITYQEATRFDELLKAIQNSFLDGESYHYFPLADIQNESLLKQNLLDHILVFENYPVGNHIESAEEEEGRLNLTNIEAFVQTNYNFNIIIGPEEELSVRFAYNENVYDNAFVQRLKGHFTYLIEQILECNTLLVDELELVTEEEKWQQLFDFNQTKADFPGNITMHQLFELQAQKTPEAPAVIFEDIVLTYGELNEKANQLAHFLRQQYLLKADTIVALMVDRSERMIIAILGILKAGAAYLPIDPVYPEDRIKFILDDAGVNLLLTDSEYMFNLSYYDKALLALDIQLPELNESTDNIPCINTSRHLAYLIYTSGSTGQPKGVMIEHRSNINMALDQIKQFVITPADKVLQFASLSFDASVYEIFMALYSGASLVLLQKELMKNASGFIDYIESKEVSIATLPPAFLSILPLDKLKFLRVIITAGEAANVNHAAYCSQFLTYYNAYGPTECAVCVSAYKVKPSDNSRKRIPIGKPLTNLEIFILNEQLQLVPVGVEGEVCVSGTGLARGYLNREILTDEKFIPHPFKEGYKLYKTGDLGKWLPDGNVEFIRRKDDQSKIRGYRIETGEIEHILKQHPGVEDAYVYVSSDENGEKSLAAVLTPNRDTARTIKQLLHLKAQNSELFKHQYELPNGMLIHHKNKGETDLIYKEIFEELTYLKYGIKLKSGDVVVDVGANIGMFSLFAGLHYPGVKVYAFEPLPPIYEYLEANIKLYNVDVTLFNLGLSSKEENTLFSYYPFNTAISGRYGNEQEEKEVVRTYMLNESAEMVDAVLDEILAERMKSEYHECKLRRLSDIIKENRIERIDLLKIDVEKSELDVLQGIDKKDWEKINQVVIEAHHTGTKIKDIEKILIAAGFSIVTEQERVLSNTNIYNIYANRPDYYAPNYDSEINNSRPCELTFNAGGNWTISKELIKDFRSLCAQKLPEYMIPSTFKLVNKVPLTTNGKVDQKALALLESSSQEDVFITPRNIVEEKLVNIWKEVLGKNKINVLDNFFEIGGHSLKATQLVSRIFKELNAKIELRELFAHPTLEGLAKIIANLERSQYEPIEAIAMQESYDASHAQKRLWVLDQLDEFHNAYNMPIACILHGELDREALEHAFKTLFDRHESLRTNFLLEDGQLKQKVHKNIPFKIQYTDLRNEPGKRDLAKVLVHEEAAAGFDLENSPLLRVKLLQMDENQHICILNKHHIISDGWSMGVIVNELSVLYNAYIVGKPSPLSPLKTHYKDYTVWQNNILEKDKISKHKNYWLNKFKGTITPLELPSDYMRPPVKTFNGALAQFNLDKPILKELNEFAVKQGSSLFMTLLATVKTLFCRYSGQEDIIIGSLIAGRDHLDLENQIGFYVNTLAMRTTFDSNESFEQLMMKVKETTLGAYEHQLYPFDQLVEDLKLDRDVSHSPLFDVMLVLQNAEIQDAVLKGISVETIPLDLNTSKFDLILDFRESTEGLAFLIGYNTDLFKRESIERMFVHFRNLLQSILKDSRKPLNELQYLSEEEINEQLSGFNRNQVRYPKHKSLKELFEEQVTKTPDAIAVSFEGKALSYRELNKLSNQLAHYLREKHELKGDDLVGLMVDRSERMIIGILGILKAGAAYVPIDPNYPEDRISYILEDASVKALLVDSKVQVEQYGLSKYSPVSFSEDWSSIATYSQSDMVAVHKPHHMAYVIYTSGSTGKPKGVMVEHRNAVRLFINEDFRFSFSSEDVWTLFHSISFDFSVWEIFGALLFGGRVIVVPRQVAQSPEEFVNLLEREGVTVLNQIPTMFNSVVSEALERKERADLRLRYVIFGGEALTPASLKGWREAYPETKLINMYGITETTVHVTYKEIGEEEISTGASNIGKAIPTLQVYIMDEKRQLVAEGVTGEIMVGGEGVSRGYLNRKELTRERFITNPYHPTERLYCSGDLGRRLKGGDIVYMGRKDNQVKIRGHRIELGEIENTLLQNILIQDVVVMAREDKQGIKQLICYFIADNSISSADLRDYLGEQLPDYMIPSFFIQVKTFPVSANGKVDRKALPAPEEFGLYAGIEYVAPTNLVEERLVIIWQEVLGINKVGVRDDFFDIGGHSLNAIQVVSKIHASLNVKIGLRELFNHSTIKSLAEVISSANVSASLLIKLNKTHVKVDNVFCIPPLVGSSTFFRGLAGHLEGIVNCYGLQCKGFDSEEAFDESIEEMAQRFIQEILKIQKEGEFILLGYSMGAAIAFEVAKQLEFKNYKSKVIMLDLGVYKLEDRNFTEEELDEQISVMVSTELGHHLDVSQARRIKKLLRQNYLNIKNYHITGKIQSDIIALEALENEVLANMQEWKNYTGGGFTHDYIDGTHLEILFDRHLPKLSGKIKNALGQVSDNLQF